MDRAPSDDKHLAAEECGMANNQACDDTHLAGAKHGRNKEDSVEIEQPALEQSKAWISLDLLLGQHVEVLRTNGTWSTGYVNSVYTDVPEPHLVIRFQNRQWKRVLLREIEANIRSSAGSSILEECFAPAGAAPEAKQTFASDDDELSDTDYLQACAQYQAAHRHRPR